MLHVQNLTVWYENFTALNEVTLTLPAGQIYGLIGPNGAGKSTMLKVCAGIIRDYDGTVRFKEKTIKEDYYRLKRQVGYAPEDVELLPYLSGKEFLQMIGGIRQLKHAGDEINFLLEMLGLRQEAEQLILNYSHGMRQKLSLAAALLGNPPLLLLDEALNGLDTLALFRLKAYLRNVAAAGGLVIIASHILPLIKEWCDLLIVMHKGSILRKLSQADIARTETEQNMSFEEFFIKLVIR